MFYSSTDNCECLLKYWQWITCNFSCEWHTKASTTTLDSPSGWKSSQGKIFHWNSYDARTSIWNSVPSNANGSKDNAVHRETEATATTNIYRDSDKILQLHCKRNRWREGSPTVDASRQCNLSRKRLGEVTLEVYIQTYLLQYNDKQHKFTTTRPKKTREEYLSSELRTVDQPFDRDTRISSNYDQWNWFLVEFNVK